MYHVKNTIDMPIDKIIQQEMKYNYLGMSIWGFGYIDADARENHEISER